LRADTPPRYLSCTDVQRYKMFFGHLKVESRVTAICNVESTRSIPSMIEARSRKLSSIEQSIFGWVTAYKTGEPYKGLAGIDSSRMVPGRATKVLG
jgi:hypothetical protein